MKYGKIHSIIRQPSNPSFFSGPIECRIREVSLNSTNKDILFTMIINRQARDNIDPIACTVMHTLPYSGTCPIQHSMHGT